MAEEDYELIPYKDISELKKELEGMRGRKDITSRELYDAVQKLSKTITDMLEVFGAAAEQMKFEEREYESDTKKQEMIIFKLDKIIEQNKTIAQGMVALVDMVKEKSSLQKEEQPLMKLQEPQPFKQEEWQPKPEPTPFMQTWQPEPMQIPQMPQPAMPNLTPPADFGMQMPPMEPTPSDLDFPEEPPLPESRKKGLFGMFKK